MDEQNKKKRGWSFGASLAVLVVLTVFTLGLGIATVLNNLRGPFIQPINVNNDDLLNSLTNQAPSIEELKKTDTDKDGLNNFDELYVYKTSPYLPDSDSDGYNDKEEIDSQHDPNCPSGQACYNLNPAAPAGNSNTNSAATSSGATTTDINELKNLTPAEIREVLLSTGQISKEQLDLIDDATLLQLYQESLKENVGQ